MYCPHCGKKLPTADARFCPACGKKVSETTPNEPAQVMNSQNQTQPIKENAAYISAKTKFIEQMKIAFLLNIACDGIAALYALLVPANKFYNDSDALKVLFLMIGIMVFGGVLLVICMINATKAFNAVLYREGLSKDIPAEDQTDIKHSSKFFAAISTTLMLGSIIILLIRYVMY